MPLNNKDISKHYVDFMNLKHRPVGVYGADEMPSDARTGGRCLVPEIFASSKSGSYAVTADLCACPGGSVYLGYQKDLLPGFEYFLSTGHPDVMGGRCERFKKSPQIVKQWMENMQPIEPVGEVTVFQALEEIPDEVSVSLVIFFCDADRISALLNLANYPTPRNDVVRAPFSAGCGTMVKEALLLPTNEPGAVMGMFDIHARQFYPKELLSMTMRYDYAAQLADEIPESFLSIEPWQKIMKR